MIYTNTSAVAACHRKDGVGVRGGGGVGRQAPAIIPHAVCVAGGAGFVVCWVGSTLYRWDSPLHASRAAFRVLSSILGEHASAAAICWPFSGNTDASHFKPVAIRLFRHKLIPFVFNGYSFTCSATILRPFLFL